MIRVLILVSLGTAISAFSMDPHIADYSHSLARLFGFNKRSDVNTKKERTVCETDDCKSAAKTFKESMNDAVDPCDDFYEYACGNWAKHNPIPKGENQWNVWLILTKKIDEQVEDLIKRDVKSDDIFAVKIAKRWYKSCMDIDRIDETGLESLLNSLWRQGGWPLIMEDGEWDDRVHKWQKVDDNYARLTGLNAFHDIEIHYIWRDKFEARLIFGPPELPYVAYANLVATKPPKHGDLSNENDESGESSNEIDVSFEDNDDQNLENDKKDENDQDVSEEKKITKRKLKTKVTYDKKKKNHKNRASKKRTDENKKKRIKRRTIDVEVHSKKQIKYKQIDKHDSTKTKVTILRQKHKAVDSDVKESAENSRVDDEDDDDDEDSNVGSGNGENNDDSEEDENEDDDNNADDSNEESDDDKEKEQAYKNAIKIVATALAETRGVKVSEEKMNQRIDDLYKFQSKMAEIRDSWDRINITLDSFQEDYDSTEPTTSDGTVDWTSKVKKLFAQAGEKYDDNLEFYVVYNYFRNLSSLLDETPSETIVNYVHWNFIVRMLKATSKDLRFMHYGDNTRDTDPKLRSKTCMDEVEITKVMDYEYARNYFPDEYAQTANDMIDDIQKEVEHQVKESSWMDDDTKHSILDKLVYMKKMVGYPDWYRNNTLVKRFFQGITVGPSYYENVLNYMRFKKWKLLQQLTKQDENILEQLSPVIVNAFFAPTYNTLAVTAADFQTPLFSMNRSRYINFAIIGFIMGHEVNHGFDTTGSHYDKIGNPMDWLPAMAKAYQKRAKCFVNQFNNYNLGLPDNITIEDYGNQTSGENIADTMGLRTVFRAYRKRERECAEPDPALPGLENFSNDQLFFLSFSHLWCQNANTDDDELITRMEYDSHSPFRLRVIGALSNSEDFAKAYKCPVGSPMNPEKKCNIWQ